MQIGQIVGIRRSRCCSHKLAVVVIISSLLGTSACLAAVEFGAKAAAANEEQPGGTLDVIVQTEQSPDALAQGIGQLGGKVRIKYRNVRAVAASIPAKQLGALTALGGVTKVVKDATVYLPEQDTNVKRANPSLGATFVGTGVKVTPMALPLRTEALPQGYVNYLYTGAASTWTETSGGDGSVVAVIDTGVARNAFVGHAVIGTPEYPEGYNAVDDGVTATYVGNNPHGTWVAGVIAGAAGLYFSDLNDPFYQAIKTYLGDLVIVPEDGEPYILLFGQAPAAKIYPVKVFPKDSQGSTAVSYILDGMDHVLALKKSGKLDIDVVNMSLGWPEVWDGHSIADQLVDEMNKAGILVAVAAGNEGPNLMTTFTPGSAFTAVTAGALDYAPSSRVYYEFLGLWYNFGPGQGLVCRPADEVRVATFSSRGPLRDGRLGPRVCALGNYNISVDPYNYVGFLVGTSFSTPTVAGAAALLNAYWEKFGRETDPTALEAALLRGANPRLVGAAWQDERDQGYGALDVPAALSCLKAGKVKLPPLGNPSDRLTANVLGNAVPGKTETWTSQQMILGPSETWDTVIEVFPWTSKLTLTFSDISTPQNWNYAVVPNEFRMQVWDPSVCNLYVYMIPYVTESLTIEIDETQWSFIYGGETYWLWRYPMQQGGLLRLTAWAGEFNESPVTVKLQVTRENFRTVPANRIANGLLRTGDIVVYPVDIPAGTATASFELSFHRDWDQIPTSNMDMYIFDSLGNMVSTEGAGLSAPERALLDAPVPGTYYVAVVGAELFKPDEYELFLTLK